MPAGADGAGNSLASARGQQENLYGVCKKGIIFQ